MLTILLTSYNRPHFIFRTLASLIVQSNPNWRCIVLDDGSDSETLDVIGEMTKDKRFQVTLEPQMPDEERRASVRYSVLINSVLPSLDTGIVGYLCDNVEYMPDLVDNVLTWFDDNPAEYSGYVLHRRDMWTKNGTSILGTAAQFGHWDYTPPNAAPINQPLGLLDHSQVFHRLPTSLRWPEDIAAVKFGDGVFFTQLAQTYGPIQPIQPGKVLTLEHLVA